MLKTVHVNGYNNGNGIIKSNGIVNGNGQKKPTLLEKISFKFIEWVGTPYSLIVHSFFFIGVFALKYVGFSVDQILLILTTVVSLEAIYLAVFIQMSVNRNTQSLEEVEEDIEDIQEDVTEEEEAHKVLLNISNELKNIQQDLNTLKKKGIL
ncbi:DUF1003 domain-containing protein [Candidatus Daviesbacteria bacterium]|nr:DUF1003 domain-containing protein [Candidatus Daviesbacteria bacterium]